MNKIVIDDLKKAHEGRAA